VAGLLSTEGTNQRTCSQSKATTKDLSPITSQQQKDFSPITSQQQRNPITVKTQIYQTCKATKVAAKKIFITFFFVFQEETKT